MGEFNDPRKMIALGIEPFEVGQEFPKLPPHMTVVPWFRGENLRMLTDVLRKIPTAVLPIEIRLGEVAMFGRKEDEPARLVEKSKDVQQLHSLGLMAVQHAGGVVADTRSTGKAYNPYVSIGRGETLADRYEITSFALIEGSRKKKRVMEVFRRDA